jgi:predicted DNA-binding ArsR family transcriptional regulator
MKDTISPADKRKLRAMRVKHLLLTGKKYTVRELNDLLYCNNVAETIRQLRKEMEIVTEWRTSENGTRYGVYYHPKEVKQSRITNQSYRTI